MGYTDHWCDMANGRNLSLHNLLRFFVNIPSSVVDVARRRCSRRRRRYLSSRSFMHTIDDAMCMQYTQHSMLEY